MKIIISPAKTMKVDREAHDVKGLPRFLDETKFLMDEIRKLSYDDAKSLWKCNDKLAELNFQRFAEMDLEKNLSPAVFSYEGIQYKNMEPGVFSDEALEYIGKHLRILSGFYGVLRPFNGVTPYRLEMQAKLAVNGCKDLYAFWGGKLYESLANECCVTCDGDSENEGGSEGWRDDGTPFTILNLASKEYSQAIEKHLEPNCRFVTVDFGELFNGKVKQKATLAKMARGDMVRYLAEGNVTELEEIKEYNGFGFKFSEEFSRKDRMVFVK